MAKKSVKSLHPSAHVLGARIISGVSKLGTNAHAAIVKRQAVANSQANDTLVQSKSLSTIRRS